MYTVGSANNRATNHRTLDNAIKSVANRIKGMDHDITMRDSQGYVWFVGGTGFVASINGENMAEYCNRYLRETLGVRPNVMMRHCGVCAAVVTNLDADENGGLEFCGDCGRATCGAHRGADGDEKAARCNFCVERNTRLAAAAAAALKVAQAAAEVKGVALVVPMTEETPAERVARVARDKAREAAKMGAAYRACGAWARDWAGEKGAPAPTPNQLVRAVVMYLYNGQPTPPMAAYGYYGADAFGCCLRFNQGALEYTRRPAAFQSGANADGTVLWRSVDFTVPFTPVPTLARAAALWARYARLCHYMREGRHGWQFVENVGYADNSTEAVYRSQLTGELRRVMTKAPGGDVCF